jgi:cytochrome c oxidase assembly protein subunit 15
MTTTERRMTALRTMAWVCAALVLAITSLSAFIRLSRAGLGCEPWPACYGQALSAAPAEAAAAVSNGVALARIAHRVVAMGALVAIVLILMTALGSRPVLWRQAILAMGLLALALFLAVLGRLGADSRVPAVVLGNLLAGFALFALSCRLLGTALPPRASGPMPRGWVAAAMAVLVLQIALGAMVSAAHAGLSCPSLAHCDLSAGSWQALNPLRAPTASADPGNPAGSLLHVLHRAGGVLVIAVVLPLAIVARRRGHRAGAWLIALSLTQLALGPLLVLAGLPLLVALAHNLVAAALLATLAML